MLLAGDRVFAAAQVTLFVKLILTVLILDPRSGDTFTLPKSVVAHGTSLVLGALLVWLFARYGRRLMVWSTAHLAVGALLIAFALATVFALDTTVAIFGTYRRYLGLTQMLDNVVLYLGAVVLIRDARALRLLGLVTLGTALPVLLYAFVQKLGLDPLKFREGTVPISFLGNPDLAGSYLAMIGITALGVALLLSDRLSRPLVGALVALGVLCNGALFITGVRAGVLALGTGFIAVVVLASVLPWRQTWWRRGMLIGVGIVAVAVIVSPVGARLRPDKLGTDAAIIQRVELWGTAEKAVAQRPILGIGPDNFVVFYPANHSEASAASGLLENSTHSFLLYVATSAGLLGLTALFALVALVIQQAIVAARRGDLRALALIPFLAYLGQSLVGVNELVLDWVFWLAAGVVAAGAGEALRRPRAGYQRPRKATLVGVVGLAAAAVAIVMFLLPRIVSAEALLASDALTNAGRASEALPYGQAAVSADPRRGETWSSYGTALTNDNKLAAALQAFTASVQREPWLPLGWKNLAIVWVQLGNRNAAVASTERAIRADPYDGEAHDLLSTIAYDAGEYARAAAEGELAIKLRLPPQESTYFTTASAYSRLKDLPKAEAIARAGAKAYPNALLRVQLAAILADEGKQAQAIAVLDALLAEQPNQPQAVQLRKQITGR